MKNASNKVKSWVLGMDEFPACQAGGCLVIVLVINVMTGYKLPNLQLKK
ncbi:MAG TPA: hypothetical protein VGK10_09910 [Prolixibacteraceae bacterium]